MKHLAYLLMACLAITAASCSVLKKDGGNKVTADNSVNLADNTSKPTKPGKPDKTNKKTGQSTTATTTEVINITPELLGGEWVIVSVKGTALPQEDQMPYVNFEPATGRFYASNGCNVLNGDFKLSPDATLTFSNVAATMNLCHDVPFEYEITQMLGGNCQPTVSISTAGHESYLTLGDPATGLTVVGRRHNMDFLNGQWRVVQLKGKVVDDEEANLFIDIDQMKVHGNTGCNYFNGDLYIDPSKTNSIEFGNMGLTRMACPKFQQEQDMMLSLEETTTAVEGDNHRVMLLNAAGDPLIVLEKAEN